MDVEDAVKYLPRVDCTDLGFFTDSGLPEVEPLLDIFYNIILLVLFSQTINMCFKFNSLSKLAIKINEAAGKADIRSRVNYL